MIEGLFQPLHLVLILTLVLIFFGPGKLTELGASLGKGMRELRRSLEEHDPPAATTAPDTTLPARTGESGVDR
jgi:sec-independent protein translocase protein TatA